MKSKITTVCGIVAGIATGLTQVPGFEEYRAYLATIAGVATVLLGVFAKDWNVTGGVAKQDTPMVQKSDITASELKDNKTGG